MPHCTVSGALKYAEPREAVVTALGVPLTRHAYDTVTVSPSTSAVMPGLQTIVSVFVGVAGLIEALAMEGAEFEMTTVLLRTTTPSVVPSLGVISHVTESPFLNCAWGSVMLVVELVMLLTCHA